MEQEEEEKCVLYDKNLSRLPPLNAHCTFLHASNNVLTDVSCLSTLTNLTTLYLNFNLLESVAVVSKLEKLVRLDVSNNNLTELPDLSKLTRLEVLQCYKNSLQQLPPGICDLPRLSKLGAMSNPIACLPGKSVVFHHI